MKKCPNCSAICKDNDFYCLKCNYPLVNENIFLTNDEYNSSNHITATTIKKINLPKCPTCSSTNIEKISSFDKAAGAVMFGLFSKTARSQFKCRNCGYKW